MTTVLIIAGIAAVTLLAAARMVCAFRNARSALDAALGELPAPAMPREGSEEGTG